MHSFVRPYKGTRVHLSPSTPSSSFAHPFLHTRALAPKSTFSSSTFSNHVQSGRQVDGLLRHGGTHQETEGSRILVCGYRASAPRCGAVHPHPQAPREGSFSHPFPPRTAFPSP